MTRSSGNKAFALSEMIHHAAPLREVLSSYVVFGPGLLGVGGRGILFSHLRNNETVTSAF